MRKTIVVLTLLGLVAVPVSAAHVEPSPEKVPAGSVSRITLSAEGEESVPAVKLTVQMPTGVTNVVAHPTSGWKQSVNGRVVTWSGGKIPHGADGKFAFSAHMPDSPGRVLVFPALVTYQDGKVVHWIGAGELGHARSSRDAHRRPGPGESATNRADDHVHRGRRRRRATPGSGSSSSPRSEAPWRRSWSCEDGSALEKSAPRRRRPGGCAGSRCRGAFRHREARLPLDDHGRRPSHAGPAVQDPVRRRPGLAREPQRQDGDHQGLQRRAVPPLRPERDLRQHQLTRRLPEPGPLRARAGSEVRDRDVEAQMGEARRRRRLGLARPPDPLHEPDRAPAGQERAPQAASHLRLEGAR